MNVVLHHSLTKDGEVVDFSAIKRFHINTRGWRDIGYHYVIEMVNGEPRTFKGRPEGTIGAHTLGYNHFLGICIVGNYDKDEVPKELLLELYKLLDDIRDRYGEIIIHGHNEYSTKTCPGKKFPLNEIKEMYREKRAHWADDAWIGLNAMGLEVHERRFDDYIKRSEVIALFYKLMTNFELKKRGE